MVDAETSVVTLNARSITVGTLSVAPAGPVLVSQDGFDLCVKKQALTRTRHLDADSAFSIQGEVTLAIAPAELTCFEYYFTNGPVGMNVAFLQTTERCARRIRSQLGLYQEALYKRHEVKDKDGSQMETRVENLPYYGPRARQKSRHRIMLEFEGEQFALQFVVLGLVERMRARSRRPQLRPLVTGLTQPQARLIVGLVVTASQHLNRPDPEAINALGSPPPEAPADNEEEVSEDGRSSTGSFRPPSDFLGSSVGDDVEMSASTTDYAAYTDWDLRRTSHSYTNLALADSESAELPKVDQNENNVQHSRPLTKAAQPKRSASQHSRKSTKRPRKSGIGNGTHMDPVKNVPLSTAEKPPSVFSGTSVYMTATSMAIGAFKGIPLSQIHVTDNIIQIGVYGLEESTTNTGPSNCIQLQMLDVVRCLLHPKPNGSSAMFIYTAPAFSARLLHRMVLSPILQRFHDTKDRFNNCNTLALLLGTVSPEQTAQIQHIFAIVSRNHPFGTLLSVIGFDLAAEYLGSCFSKDLSTACRVNELVGTGRAAKDDEPAPVEPQDIGNHSPDGSLMYRGTHINTPSSIEGMATVPGAEGMQSQDAESKAVAPPVAVLMEDGDLVMVKSEVTTKCPYTQQTMTNPVRNVHCGHNYEEESILQYVKTCRKTPLCPVLGCSNPIPLIAEDLKPNTQLKEYIENAEMS